jgi:hypothetical protein
MPDVAPRTPHPSHPTSPAAHHLDDGFLASLVDYREVEHLVGRLRELRGRRQYLFASRSPGLVVSADAEMIITMTSDVDSGRIEGSGSLERYELNRLPLHHLEGGPRPVQAPNRKACVVNVNSGVAFG